MAINKPINNGTKVHPVDIHESTADKAFDSLGRP